MAVADLITWEATMAKYVLPALAQFANEADLDSAMMRYGEYCRDNNLPYFLAWQPWLKAGSTIRKGYEVPQASDHGKFSTLLTQMRNKVVDRVYGPAGGDYIGGAFREYNEAYRRAMAGGYAFVAPVISPLEPAEQDAYADPSSADEEAEEQISHQHLHHS